jgi:hypothetical protein
MKQLTRTIMAACLACIGLAGCNPERPEPGSDMPVLVTDAGGQRDVVDELPTLPPGSSLNGTYVAVANVKTPDNIVNVPLVLIWNLHQAGVIEQGSAALSGSLYIDTFESTTKKDFANASVSALGAFHVDVQNMLIPKELNPLLKQDVSESALAFQNGQVLSSCRFTGHLKATLKNVVSSLGSLPEVILEGDFGAIGTADACAAESDGGLPETGKGDTGADVTLSDGSHADADGSTDVSVEATDALEEGADAATEATDAEAAS